MLVTYDPEQRLSAKQALEQPWFDEEFRHSNTLLDSAVISFKKRATLKQKTVASVNNIERLSLGHLQTELTRYGLDNDDNAKLHKSLSVMYDKEFMADFFQQNPGLRNF